MILKQNAFTLQKQCYYLTKEILLQDKRPVFPPYLTLFQFTYAVFVEAKKLLFYSYLQSKSSFFINRHTTKIIKITHKMFHNQNYFRKLIS